MVKKGRENVGWNIPGGKRQTTRSSPESKTQILNSSLLLPLPISQAGPSRPLPPLSPCYRSPQTLLPWTFWGPVIQDNYQILPVKTWWIRERKKKNHQEPEKPASSPWPPLELSFQLNDNRFCLRNCYVIWCMGVIWLRTRDGSTSHKILPEFSDLCVLLLLLLCATWPIYLL